MNGPAARRGVTGGDPPTVLGPYELSGILGQGGMGVVYRGKHLATGEIVAVKTLRVVDGPRLAAIRREITALAQVKHPGIVRIVAHGVREGLPWYAMEILEGQTLRDEMRLARATGYGSDETQTEDTERESGVALSGSHERRTRGSRGNVPLGQHGWFRLLELMSAVCETLAHLHAAGFVHRDLKPENIFIRSDGSPVLVDLGICGRFGGSHGREALELPDERHWSLGYAAPEQIRGALVDARADLYAVGCILYECITGMLPGSEGNALGPHHAAIGHRPFPPSHFVPGVSPGLDQLISRLLEHEPDRRLGYSDEVAWVLRKEVDAPDSQRLVRDAPAYLYRPSFVGRESQLDGFNNPFQALIQEGRSSVFLVGGESGVGKTRFALELIRRARLKGAQVVLSQCGTLGIEDASKQSDAPPLSAFLPALLAAVDRCHERGPTEAPALFGKLGRMLVSYQPRLAEVPGYDALPELPPIPPDGARLALLTCLGDVLFRMASDQPLMLAIDDLQWADALSIELVARLAETAPNRPGLMVVATYRVDEASSALQQVRAIETVQNVQLERLRESELGVMVQTAMALERTPADLVSFLFAKCGGNAAFALEYLRAAVAEGLFARGNGVWQLGAQVAFDPEQPQPTVPSHLSGLIQRRLDRLSADERALVDLGAVLGREFVPEVLLACCNLSQEQAVAALRALQSRQVLEEAESGVRFVHDAVRESAYDAIPEASRKELHAAAGAVIEGRCRAEPALWRAAAHHFAQAGMQLEAARRYLLSAEHAKASWAHDDAIKLARDAKDQLDGVALEARSRAFDSVAMNCRETLGDLLTLSASRETAREEYRSAVEHAKDDALAGARLQRKLGKTFEFDRAYPLACDAYVAAEERLETLTTRKPDWWREWLDIQVDRIWAYYFSANLEGMKELIERVGDRAERFGTALQRAHFLNSHTTMRARAERYRLSDETVAMAREALVAGLEAGDASQLPLFRFGVGFALLFHDDLAEAEEVMREAAREAERVGDRALHSRILAYLLLATRRLRKIEQTRQLAATTGAIASRTQMKDYIGAAQANEGWVLLMAGKHAEAEALLRDALAVWSAPPAVYPFEWLALFPLLSVECRRQNADGCLTVATALLKQSQQRFSDALDAKLRMVLAAGTAARVEVALQACEMAVTRGYL